MAYGTVFVVSADAAIRDSLSELVASAGSPVETFSEFDAWLETVPPARQGCLVLDTRTCDTTNPERHAGFPSVCAGRPVLLLIDRGDVPAAVRAIKDGAVDVLEMPCRDENALERIRRCIDAAGCDSKRRSCPATYVP